MSSNRETAIWILAGAALLAVGAGTLWTRALGKGDEAKEKSVVVAGTYVGSKKCKKCHRVEYKSWEKTKMAVSFEILAPGAMAAEKTAAKLDPEQDYRKDAKCVGCHTVGFGEEGGFSLKASDRDNLSLLGVGCESCHGPAGGWLANGLHDSDYKEKANHAERLPLQIAKGYVPEPKEEDCKRCHNEKSPSFKEAFDYEKRKDEGVHEHPKK